MGVTTMLAGPIIGMSAMLAARYAASRRPEPGYPAVPSMMDPSVWAAGISAARRQPPASGQPQGLDWATANQLTPWMPGLIAR